MILSPISSKTKQDKSSFHIHWFCEIIKYNVLSKCHVLPRFPIASVLMISFNKPWRRRFLDKLVGACIAWSFPCLSQCRDPFVHLLNFIHNHHSTKIDFYYIYTIFLMARFLRLLHLPHTSVSQILTTSFDFKELWSFRYHRHKHMWTICFRISLILKTEIPPSSH